MSDRVDHKQARRAERLRREEQARRRQQHQRTARRAGCAAVGLIAAALVTVAIVGGTSSSARQPAAGGVNGGAVGTIAPAFALRDVVSGKQVTLRSLAGHKTLLFFSEGVGCQACMVQAADLQRSQALAADGIKLVS